jgi:hypothetical protein
MFVDPLAASSSRSTLSTTLIIALAWALLIWKLWSIGRTASKLGPEADVIVPVPGGLPAEFLPRMLPANEMKAVLIAMCAILTIAAYAGSWFAILTLVPLAWLFGRVFSRRRKARAAAADGFSDFAAAHSADEVEHAREILIDVYGPRSASDFAA